MFSRRLSKADIATRDQMVYQFFTIYGKLGLPRTYSRDELRVIMGLLDLTYDSVFCKSDQISDFLNVPYGRNYEID